MSGKYGELREYLCPRCGKLTGTNPDSLWACPICGYPDLIDVERGDMSNLVFNEDVTALLKEAELMREKYLDKTNPIFSQEWCKKREADDKRMLAEEKEEEQKRLEYERKKAEEEAKYVPRCPTCGSPRVHRIDKWESMFRKLQFECSKCGYQW